MRRKPDIKARSKYRSIQRKFNVEKAREAKAISNSEESKITK